MPSESYVSLKETYGLVPAHAQRKVKDLEAYKSFPAVANGVNNAKVRYPDAYDYLKWSGWTDEQFLNLSACSAAGTDAVMSGQYKQWGNDMMSRVNVDIPEGEFFMTIPFPKAMGQYEGVGPHAGWNPQQAATCLRVWKEQWQGKAGEDMFAMRSANWGRTDTGDAWMHGGSVDKIAFVGNNSNGWLITGWTEHGLGLWDEGEVSDIKRVYSVNHNGYGIMSVRGTPFTSSGVLSLFTNAKGGIGLIGSQLATIRIGTISGDDNAAMVVMEDGFGRKAGGNIGVHTVKSEAGKRPINHGQIVLWQKSPCVGNLTFGNVQMDQNWVMNDAAFVMQNREWGQVMNVGTFNGWNFNTLVHDVTNKKRWAGSSYHPEAFVYCSRNGGTVSDLTTLTMMQSSPVNADDRLGTAANAAGFNYTTGTPRYYLTGTAGTEPPPPPPPPPPVVVPMTATAWAQGSDDGRPHDPAMIVDGIPSSFWISGKSMKNDGTQVVTATCASLATFKGIEFDVPPGYNNSYPRKFEVKVDGLSKGAAFVGGTTSRALFSLVTAKKIEVICREDNGNWWGISDFRLIA